MLLAECLLLLALDPLSGRFKNQRALDQRVLRAALLLELASLRELVLRDGKLVLQQHLPSYHLLVEDVHQRLRGRAPVSAASTLRQRGIAASGLADRLLQGLADRDVLHRDGRRSFWLFGRRDYPVRSMQAHHDAHALIERGLIGPGFDLKATAFLILLRRSALCGRFVDLPEQEAIGKRLGQLHRSLYSPASTIPALDQPALRTMWEIGEALEASAG